VTFGAASHHDVMLLLVQMAVLLTTARLLGEVCFRFGQPAVLGELAAGILFGPSVLGTLIPAVGQIMIPHSKAQGHILEVVSLLGAIFLLFITGLETDLQLIRHRLRTALGVWAGGVIFPLLGGFALGMVLPDELLGSAGKRIVFALFMGTAMSISSISVISKVLRDLGLIRRDIGQIILASGMSEDSTGWILLSIVVALASGAGFSWGEVAGAVAKVVGYLLLSFTLGRQIVRRALRQTQDRILSRDRMITLVLVVMLCFGAIALLLGLEAVLGAFVAGVILSTMPRLPKEVGQFYESLALGLFAPIFFAVAGLKVNARLLLQPKLAAYTLAIIAVACGGKVIGTYLGARLIGGTDHWTALSLGAGLNARGSLEIIVATIGLSQGILSQAAFSMIVVIAPVTSLLAPVALRYTLSKVHPSAEEQERLQREAQASQSWLGDLHRVLVPVRYRADASAIDRPLERAVLAKLGAEQPLSLTLLTVVPEGEGADGDDWLAKVAEDYQAGEINRRVVESKETVKAILEEARKDYQLVVLGATETTPDDRSLFSPVIDQLVRLSPCPTLVLRRGQKEDVDLRCMLVPTNGGSSSRRAADLALKLAQSDEHFVEFLHVLAPRQGRQDAPTRRVEIEQAHQAVTELVKLGEELGVACGSEIRTADGPAAAIIDLADNPRRVDLVILGSDVRPGGRLFLGSSVERVLQRCRASVIVVNE
jgi:Kef-type K+ transport system membrane component KefB